MANGITSNNYVTLYSSRAHVFVINPETRNTWLARVDRAIPVSFAASIIDNEMSSTFDSSKRELKIIGTGEDGSTVLESIISPKTTLTKRTQKFLQWTDPTDTTNGLGFNSDAELTEFYDTFQKLQRDMLAPQAHRMNPVGVQSNVQSNMATHNDRLATSWNQQQQQLHMNDSVSETTNGRFQPTRVPGISSNIGGQASSMPQANTSMLQHSNTLAQPGHQQQIKRQPPIQQTVNPSNGNTSLNNGNLNNSNANHPRSQSMFGLQSKTGTGGSNSSNNLLSSGKVTPETENSQMSQNEWQIRDQLKYENERLKQALEESSKNAGVWHNELLNLRTNNVKLTQALQESKAHVEEWERELLRLRDENKGLKLRVSALESASDPDKDYKEDLEKYQTYLEDVQNKLRRRENEISELQRSMEELELKTSSNYNDQLEDSHSTISAHQKEKFNIINAKFEAKVIELADLQKEFAQLLVDKQSKLAPYM